MAYYEPINNAGAKDMNALKLNEIKNDQVICIADANSPQPLKWHWDGSAHQVQAVKDGVAYNTAEEASKKASELFHAVDAGWC
jgi:hypothetical protein